MTQGLATGLAPDLATGASRRQAPVQAIHIISAAPFSPAAGTGIAMSITNLTREVRRLGVVTEFPLRCREESGSLAERTRLNQHIDVSRRGVLLCIDLDGFAISGRRSGGSTWKAVHVRTNFLELLRIAPPGSRPELAVQARLLKRNIATADLLITSSRHTMHELQTALVPLPARRLLLPNALDQELASHLKQLPTTRSSSALIVAYGMATWRKDFATAIRASARLAARGVDHRFDLMIGGPDRPRLEALIRRLGATHIRLLDLTPSRVEIARLLRRAWVVCHPALQEDFGNVFVEAAAAGVPVVAVRSPIAVEHRIEASAGLLVPARDVDRFVNALEVLLCRQKADEAQAREPLPIRYHSWTWQGAARRLVAALDALVAQEPGT
jgi:glycosyltransferase involved in cell wall biosynthesis